MSVPDLQQASAATGSTCCVCGGAPTVESHLFPRALAHDLRGSDKHLYVGGADEPGKRVVQSGLIDRGILCYAHEQALNPYDTYGIDFLRSFKAKCSHPRPDIWRVSDVDGDKLTRFWLSILWRFGVSSLREAGLVKLGPFADRLRDILFAGTQCSPEPAVTMVRFRSRVILPEGICFPPFESGFPVPSSIYQGRPPRGWGIAVAGFQAYVKLDSRRLPPRAYHLNINGQSEIQGAYIEFENTHHFRGIQNIVRNMGLKRPAPVRR